MTESKHDNLKQELAHWKELLESGLITQEMYDRAANRLLDQVIPGVGSVPYRSVPYRPVGNTLVDLKVDMEIGPDNHRFRLVREIGGGGMGCVWQAHDLSAEALEGGTQYKAIKVVTPELRQAGPPALKNLKREALRAAKLNHPNIINVNGWQQGDDDWLFVEMEYLEGRDLSHLLFEEGEHGLPVERVLSLLKQMAKALDYAHQEHSIIHRDLKPGNVHITEADRIKILDFGLAYQLRKSHSSVSNAKVDRSGTPIYMPPEAFVACKPDPRQDVYALACLTYELLTGQPPYSEEAARMRPANLYPPQPEGITDQAWEVLKQGFGYEREMRPDGAGVFYQSFSDGLREQVKVIAEDNIVSEGQKDQDSKVQEKPDVEVSDRIELDKLQRKAEQGDAFAHYQLGMKYELGEGVTKDVNEAVRWYQLAAEQGDIDMQYLLGEMYALGDGVAKDEKEAVRWFRQAAEQGLGIAQFIVGNMYKLGKGVDKDYKEAVKWYRLAAEQGDDDGQTSLGMMYENGCGVTKDEKEAVKWYRLAAEQGNDKAKFLLSEAYRTGQGVIQDDKEAVKWCRQAAQSYGAAQACLGLMYAEGKMVAKDDKEAVRWYRRAAESGDYTGLFELRSMYELGRGVTKDEKDVVKWYRQVAEEDWGGYIQINFGMMYEYGRGVTQDEKEAVRWYRKAAELGNADAQINLGKMYEYGRGVTKDEKVALRWYRKAAEQGNDVAKLNLGRLEKKTLID